MADKKKRLVQQRLTDGARRSFVIEEEARNARLDAVLDARDDPRLDKLTRACTERPELKRDLERLLASLPPEKLDALMADVDPRDREWFRQELLANVKKGAS